MPYDATDKYITTAKGFAAAANDAKRDMEERKLLAQLATAYAQIATAQAAENAHIVKPLWR